MEDTTLIAVPAGDHIDAIENRREEPQEKVGRRKKQPVPVVLTGDEAPMPRATAKQMRDAKKKAESASRVNGLTQEHMDANKKAKVDWSKGVTEAQPTPTPVGVTGDGNVVVALPDGTLATMGGQAATKLLDDMKQGEAAQAPAIPATGYQGPMRSLRERLKQGAYKKAPNGQPSCGDEVATILGHLEPAEVIRACMIAMNLTVNPYAHLNIGQQSMNLRNKLRGMMKRGEFGGGVLREAVEVVLETRPAKPADQTPAPAPVEPAPAPQAEPTPAPEEKGIVAAAKRAAKKAMSPRQKQGK